jgi:hypothetical protein
MERYETQAELFEDEKQLGAYFAAQIIYGVLLLVILFLTGWLGFDSPWWGLLIGVIVLFYFLVKIVRISMARNEYLEFLEDNADEAEEFGVDREIAKAQLRTAAKVLERASSRKE